MTFQLNTVSFPSHDGPERGRNHCGTEATINPSSVTLLQHPFFVVVVVALGSEFETRTKRALDSEGGGLSLSAFTSWGGKMISPLVHERTHKDVEANGRLDRTDEK